MDTLEDLKKRLREFARERDWEQFHSPKNLSMALIVEAAELVEHFQWLTEAQSQKLPEKPCAKLSRGLPKASTIPTAWPNCWAWT